MKIACIRRTTSTALLAIVMGLATVLPVVGAAASSIVLDQLSHCRRIYHCVRTSQRPQIDGKLNDECWATAQLADHFMNIKGTAFVLQQTVARALYDDEALYVAFECREADMEHLVIEQETGSGNVWMDDSVELFLNAQHTHQAGNYHHFAVNPVGAWDGPGPCTVATSRGDEVWYVEAAIPFSTLGTDTPKLGQVWAMNFNREERPHSELSAWSCTHGYFHNPEHFADMVFGTSPTVEAFDLGLSRSTIGEKVLRSYLYNPSKSRREIMVRLELRDGYRSGMYGGPQIVVEEAEKTIQLLANSARQVELPYLIETPAQYRADITVKDLDTNEVVYQASHYHEIVAAGLASSIWPQERYGDVLYACAGTAQHFNLVFGNYSDVPKRFRFVLEMPTWLQLINPSDRPQTDGNWHPYFPMHLQSKSVRRHGRSYRRYELTFAKPIPADLELDRVANFRTLPLLVQVPMVPGRSATIFYHVEDIAGEDVEPEHQMSVNILPPLNGKQPEQVEIGLFSWSLGNPHAFRPGRQADAVLRTWQQAGINLLVGGGRARGEEARQFLQQLQQAELRTIANFWWFWWDQSYLKDHPEHTAVHFDGSREDTSEPTGRICPIVLLDPTSGALDATLANLTETVKLYTRAGAVWDLEGPGAFDVCFCQRCLAAFREFAGIPADEQLTPQYIKQEYHSQWVDFACSQAASMAEKLTEAVHGGNPAARFYVYSGYGQHARERYRSDWKMVARVIDVATPSHYTTAAEHLRFVEGDAHSIGGQIRAANPDIAVGGWLFAGYPRQESSGYLRDPQFLKAQILQYIFHGYTAGVYLWYDEPCDGRHYQAIAQASRIVADLESFLLEGRELTDWLELPANVQVDRLTGDGYLSAAVWEKDDKKVVLLFNHEIEQVRSVQLDLPIGRDEQICTYPDREVLPGNNINMTIEPLDAVVLFVEPK